MFRTLTKRTLRTAPKSSLSHQLILPALSVLSTPQNVKKYSTGTTNAQNNANVDAAASEAFRLLAMRSYQNKQNIYHMMYIIVASITLYFVYATFRTLYDVRRREVEALLEYLHQLEQGEPVNENKLFLLLTEACAALFVTTWPLPQQDVFTKEQERLFLQTPKFWDVMLNLMLTHDDPGKRIFFDTFVTELVRDYRVANAIAKDNYTGLLAQVSRVGSTKEDLKTLDHSTRSAMSLLLRLLGHRSTHQFLTLSDMQRLEKLLSNEQFYHSFMVALTEAKNEALPAVDNTSSLLVRFPEFQNILCRKAPSGYSPEKLKHFIDNSLHDQIRDEKGAQSFFASMKLAPVILFPLLHYIAHGYQYRWINVQNFRMRAGVLALSLALMNFMPKGPVGETSTLIGTLIALRLSPMSAVVDEYILSILHVEQNKSRIAFADFRTDAQKAQDSF